MSIHQRHTVGAGKPYAGSRTLVARVVREEGAVILPQDDASALVIGITRITEAGLGLDLAIAPESLQIPQDEDLTLRGAVYIQGRFQKVAEQIYFQGGIRGVITAPCSRCLEVVHASFEIETRVVFLPLTSAVADEEGGQEASDTIDLYFHDGMTLDLRPLVREHVVLAFPVQPLCRADCAGLCQVCGKNQNLEPCGCQVQAGDPRFAILQRLRGPKTS